MFFIKIKNQYKKTRGIVGLALVLAKTDFKLRNEGSYLGILWYLLNPILMFVLLYFIFNDRLGKNISHYPLYLLLGIVMFNFFQNITIETTKSIIREHRHLIKSIKFTAESLIVSVLIKNILSHFFELLIIIFLMVYLGAGVINIIFYPLILSFFCIFVLGFSFVLSSLAVYFADLDNIWSFGIRLLWLATPIFYAVEGQTRLFYLNLFNPLYYFITFARETIVYSRTPEPWLISGVFFFSLFFFLIGLTIFNKLKTKFSEMV